MLEMILASATSLGLRSGPNPAVWRGHLENIMPRHDNGAKAHHAAMAYSEVPEFVAQLRTVKTTPALALEFLTLTACRSGEVRFARWDELDFDGKVWTIPAARMKADREHKVPLCARAIQIPPALMAEARFRGDFATWLGTRRHRDWRNRRSDAWPPPSHSSHQISARNGNRHGESPSFAIAQPFILVRFFPRFPAYCTGRRCGTLAYGKRSQKSQTTFHPSRSPHCYPS
jgi:hypothetical protein